MGDRRKCQTYTASPAEPGGLLVMLAISGTIPNVGEHVEAHGWRFEIVDLDGRRIDKVLVTKIANPKT